MTLTRRWLAASILLVACDLGTAQDAGAPGPRNVRDFGAVGGGRQLDTRAIQAAIDAAAAAGGGTVYFPAGVYLSGTIYLKDHVRLDLETGATLLGSTDVRDYPFHRCGFASRVDRYNGRALIWSEGRHDLAITGHGTIDGQGAQFRDRQPTPEQYRETTSVFAGTGRYRPSEPFIDRPFLIRLIGCREILVENVELRCSAMWMQHYQNCEFVTLRGVRVFNHGCRNNDMVDIDGCRNVVITGCFADTDDDALTLKSTAGTLTENVMVSNCVVRSHCSAIKAGTESSGGFHNVTITNCVIRPSAVTEVRCGRPEGLAGVALEVVDGGSLDGVTVSNLSIEKTSTPVFLRLGNRARPYREDGPKPPVGTFRNVVIDNVVARGAGKTGCSIVGIPGHAIENVTLSNIKIRFDGGGTREQAQAQVPELESQYPEGTMFGTLPAHAFFCRHVDGLTLRDVDCGWDRPDLRPALVCEDVQNLRLDGLCAAAADGGCGQMLLRDTHDALITGCRPPSSEMFLRLEGPSARISVLANDLSRVRTPFTLDAATPPTALHAEFNRLPEK